LAFYSDDRSRFTLLDQVSARAVRLKFPPRYVVPAHTHPALESVTVLTGSMGSGMGDKVDTSKGKMLGEGSLLILPANHAHYVWTEDKETIIQVAATGPFDIIYVNPDEDPRKKNRRRAGGNARAPTERPAATQGSGTLGLGCISDRQQLRRRAGRIASINSGVP